MAGETAHMEIGFRWREDAGAFDATIEYDDPEDRGDQRDFARSPIFIDTDELRTLEPGEYGRRLTEMALGPIEQFYANARRVWQGPDTPLHLRLFIDPS